MKVPVYVRDQNDEWGMFLGHAEHSELEDVVSMFKGVNMIDVFTQTATFSPDGYLVIGTQFASDRQDKNLVFEIILAGEES